MRRLRRRKQWRNWKRWVLQYFTNVHSITEHDFSDEPSATINGFHVIILSVVGGLISGIVLISTCVTCRQHRKEKEAHRRAIREHETVALMTTAAPWTNETQRDMRNVNGAPASTLNQHNGQHLSGHNSNYERSHYAPVPRSDQVLMTSARDDTATTSRHGVSLTQPDGGVLSANVHKPTRPIDRIHRSYSETASRFNPDLPAPSHLTPPYTSRMTSSRPDVVSEINGVDKALHSFDKCDVTGSSRRFESQTLPSRAFHRNRSVDSILNHGDGVYTRDQQGNPLPENTPARATTLHRQHSLGSYITTPSRGANISDVSRKAPILPERRTAYKEEYAMRGRSKEVQSHEMSPRIFYTRPNKAVRHADV